MGFVLSIFLNLLALSAPAAFADTEVALFRDGRLALPHAEYSALLSRLQADPVGLAANPVVLGFSNGRRFRVLQGVARIDSALQIFVAEELGSRAAAGRRVLLQLLASYESMAGLFGTTAGPEYLLQYQYETARAISEAPRGKDVSLGFREAVLPPGTPANGVAAPEALVFEYESLGESAANVGKNLPLDADYGPDLINLVKALATSEVPNLSPQYLYWSESAQGWKIVFFAKPIGQSAFTPVFGGIPVRQALKSFLDALQIPADQPFYQALLAVYEKERAALVGKLDEREIAKRALLYFADHSNVPPGHFEFLAEKYLRYGIPDDLWDRLSVECRMHLLRHPLSAYRNYARRTMAERGFWREPAYRSAFIADILQLDGEALARALRSLEPSLDAFAERLRKLLAADSLARPGVYASAASPTLLARLQGLVASPTFSHPSAMPLWNALSAGERDPERIVEAFTALMDSEGIAPGLLPTVEPLLYYRFLEHADEILAFVESHDLPEKEKLVSRLVSFLAFQGAYWDLNAPMRSLGLLVDLYPRIHRLARAVDRAFFYPFATAFRRFLDGRPEVRLELLEELAPYTLANPANFRVLREQKQIATAEIDLRKRLGDPSARVAIDCPRLSARAQPGEWKRWLKGLF